MAEATGGAGSYDFPIDLQNLNSVPAQLARHIPAHSRILDVGCASGNLSGFLIRERGCSVVGVERDPAAASAAAAKGLDTRVLDLDTSSLAQALQGERFDRIILADVLEHLLHPAAVLRAAVGLLGPRGQVLVSIPNISHVDVILALLHDRWEYRDSGLLDRTHLRFFTEAGFRELAASAGVRVRSLHRLTLPPFHTELWAGAPRPPNDARLHAVVGVASQLNRNFGVYQFVFVLDRPAHTWAALRSRLRLATEPADFAAR
ncbi:MAG: class I SAM-dependent methyltransferase [Candidatus Dormibacteraeota bacterium]|nr:class I SAM-dependent methyltransferase [Candidatus Dormibacteraeota bacterium]